ncbi:MAG: NADPH:quinone reductase-like Zn-dependent oxidoreductase [Planctomycetota bacterium]|jgi:NADPH:quinone reductase-like Zn-dependent oxidoreductase
MSITLAQKATPVAPPSQPSMTAMVHDTYGGPEVLTIREVPIPVLAPDEVLVQVRAAGLDRGVWHLMTGLPYLIRAVGFGLRAPKNPILGMDVAGVVHSIGSAVTDYQPGDEVYGICNGSFAEYAAVKETKLALKPRNLDFTQAAAVPISAGTALQGIQDHAGAGPGKHVLITGAGGGVGTYAVQIAKHLGATVTAVDGPTKQDLLRSLGADHTIDYRSEDFTKSGIQYDAIMDIAGNRSLRDLRRALTPKGKLVITGGEEGDRWIGGVDRQLRAMAMSPFTSQTLGTFIAHESNKSLQTLTTWVEAGQIKPIIDRTFPLSEGPAAMRYMIESHVQGKVVITV